jgi:hypothetical protein
MPVSLDSAGEAVVSVARASGPAGGERAASGDAGLGELVGLGELRGGEMDAEELAFLGGVEVDTDELDAEDEPAHEAAARLVAGVLPEGMTERPRLLPDGISAVLTGEWSDELEALGGPVDVRERGALLALIRAAAPRLTLDAVVVLADAVEEDAPVLVRHVSGLGAVRQTGLHNADVDEDVLYGCSDEKHEAVEISMRSVVDVLPG